MVSTNSVVSKEGAFHRFSKVSLLAEVSHEEAKMSGGRDLCRLLTRYLMISGRNIPVFKTGSVSCVRRVPHEWIASF